MSAAMTESRSKDSWQLAEGDQITPHLTAMKKLGGGAAYEAYAAFDEVTYGPVVVKLVRPDQVDDASTLRGLRREVASLAAVNHPVVVRGLRHQIEGERPHIVLEHIDGPRLSSLIRRYGPLQEAQYLPLAIEVAAAAHYFRQIGFVHLDIKPSNIIMGAPARLIDLSVMRTSKDTAALTYPIGTDDYMAPEQCEPPLTGIPGPASDIWGLGATLFEAVSGYRAFPDTQHDADELAVRFPQTARTPAALPDRVPPVVAQIIRACLSPQAADRPEPHQVADALEPVLAGLPRGRLAGFKVRG